MYRVSPLLIVLFLAGCATSNERYVQNLKTESLERYATQGIDAVVPFPEKAGSDTEIRSIPVVGYLAMHTGLILSGDDLDEEEFREMTSHIHETRTESGIDFEINISKNREFTIGAAAPITDDGYFLTARHVIEESDAHLLYVTSDEDHTYIDSGICRVVSRDPKTDIAIIRVEVATPRYLRIRETPMEKGEVVFGGNPILSQCAAGTFTEESIGRKKKLDLLEEARITDGTQFKTSIPGMHGDSGSPLIDKSGQLCGILIETGFLGPVRLERFQNTYVVGLERNAIMKIIALDRKRTQRDHEVTDH